MNGKDKFMKVVRKQPEEVQFENVSFRIGKKEILHSVNGRFSPGQLIGILGASGSGKTTLLNVLMGQMRCSCGEIFINNQPRDMNKFKKVSAYLMQEDLLQPFLTVKESMTITSYLKLGDEYSPQDRATVVNDILSVMRLNDCLEMKVEKLSGGERKRLTIALELINNPPVIFLDEPTSGLDNVAMKKCVKMLKFLANQGRTIICAIHQPSHSAFQLFDLVYFLSEGCCVYNGTVDGMVPFLSNLGLNCPLTYSPSDYILEILNFDQTTTKTLSQAIQNGKTIVATSKSQKITKEINNEVDESKEFPLGFFGQSKTLLYRKWLQLKRNKIMMILEVLHHVMCGCFLGILFYDVGNSGTKSYSNINLYLVIVMYIMYTQMLSPVLLCNVPDEIRFLRREYLNRWYSLKAYFTAVSISVLPMMIFTSLLYLTILYPMTGQPMELARFLWFFMINLTMSITANGLGYAVGSVLKPLHGATFCSAISVPLLSAGIHNMGHADQSSNFGKIIVFFSFPYDAWVGLTTSMLNDRQLFECEDIFCYFGSPKFLLKKIGMEGKSQYVPTLILILFLVAFKAISYVSLRFRLSQRYDLVMMKIKPLMKMFNLDQ